MSSTSGRLRGGTLRLMLAIAGVASMPAAAFADAVPRPPASCPDGSIPESSHSGPYCWVPAPCKTDESCRSYESDAKGALVCRPTAVCVRPKTLVHRTAGKREVPEAIGACEGSATCGDGAKCERESRCAPPVGAPPATASPTSSPAPADAAPPPGDAAPSPRPASDPGPSAAPRSSCFCAATGSAPVDVPAISVAVIAAVALACRRRQGLRS